MAFKRIPKVDFEPLEQIQQGRPAITPSEPPSQAEEAGLSRAENIVEEYDKTIEFSDWLISLIDDRIKDVVIQVDPEQYPEVWTAMERIFKDSVNPNLTGNSYVRVLEAIRECNRLELQEAQEEGDSIERQFIESIPSVGDAIDAPTPEMDVLDEDEEAIQEAITEREFSTDPNKRKRDLRKHWRRIWKRIRLIKFKNGERVNNNEIKKIVEKEIAKIQEDI